MKMILLLFFLFLFSIAKSQNTCSPQNLFKTNYLGDGKDIPGLHLPFNFIIKQDSLIISVDTAGRNVFAAFRILGKECFWNEDFSEGKSTYKLMLGDISGNKYAILNIVIDKKQPVYIELLYENSEKRVFSQ